MHRIKQRCIFGLRLCPRRELSLIGLLLGYRTQTAQAHHFALPLLPRIGYRGVNGSIGDTHLGTLGLLGRYYIQTLSAERNFHRVRHFGNILYGIRNNILLRITGETVNHSKVALINAFGRNLKVTCRAVRLIIFRILRWAVILVGIYTENREITRMTRPNPVVGITTELTY